MTTMATAAKSVQATASASRAYLVAKRAMDLLGSGLALLFLAPVFTVVALIIKLEDGGPVFFSQKRVGKGGREFKFYKFRSMCVDAEAKRAALKEATEDDSVRFKMTRDPRITRIGRIIRRFSIDEMPQFINVLLGDMSLVGPRPALPEEVAEYTDHEMQRLSVEQGLTCTWQVTGRSLIPFEEQVELDIDYARERTLWGDVKLLVMTVPAVMLGKGAY